MCFQSLRRAKCQKADIKEIEKINHTFYEALNNANIDLMEEVWIKDDSAKCVHPGWSMLKGWKDIRDSWVKIF